DITARKQLEARLLRQAFHDSLTGLPNRALFTDRIEQALTRARRHNATVVVIFLDLDGFKAVNDEHGHGGGDQLLIEIGQRLRGWVREGDTVARLGGDEFTVLLDDLRSPAEALLIAERIIEGLRAPMLVDGQLAWVRASLGIAYNTPPEITSAELLRNADVALYRAKHAGGDRHRIFDESDTPERIATVELRATYP
ncbi:MAG: diguanylate cyclase domain-containing protein, partial [Vicinamibacterales bacterium]